MLPSIIGPSQRAFMKGRDNLENAYVVLELIHSILVKVKRLANGKPCLAMKLDLTKAYD